MELRISLIAAGLFSIIVLVLVKVLLTRPRYFWLLALGSTIVSSGITYFTPGYALTDEFFACIVAVAGLVATRFHRPGAEQLVNRKFHIWFKTIYYGFLIYLVLQSLRGAVELQDWRILRFALLYIILAVYAFLRFSNCFPSPSRDQVVKVIFGCSFVQLASYLLHGVISLDYRGISYQVLQSGEWAGTAYATFPALIGICSGFVYAMKGGAARKSLYLAFLMLLGAIAWYYDSRATWIVLTSYFCLFFIFANFSRKLMAILALVLAFWIFGTSLAHIFEDIRYDVNPATSRDGRLRYGEDAVSFLNDDSNVIRMIVGYGIYVHRVALKRLYFGYDFVRVTGFAGFLVDTGYLGFFWLLCIFIFATLEVSRIRGIGKKERIAHFVNIALTFFWFFATPLQDVFYFYLVVMPYGISYFISDPGARPITSRTKSLPPFLGRVFLRRTI